MMNFILKSGKYIMYVITASLLVGSLGVEVEARQLFQSIDREVDIGIEGTQSYLFYGRGGAADVDFEVNLDKTVNFVNRTTDTIVSKYAQLTPGETIQFQEQPTDGSWFITGGYFSSPPLGSGVKRYLLRDSYPGVGPIQGDINLKSPQDTGTVYISSDNKDVIECQNKICEAKTDGTATITIKFASEKQGVRQRGFLFGPGGYGVINGEVQLLAGAENPEENEVPIRPIGEQKDIKLTYDWGAVQYTFEVSSPNSPPSTQYENTTDITQTKATSNWTYSDPDGDAYEAAQVQLATDANFNNIVKRPDPLTGGNGAPSKSYRWERLSPDTQYYPRVRVQDSQNAWSEWARGESFQTNTSGPPKPTVELSVDQTEVQPGDMVTLDWSTSNANSCEAVKGVDANGNWQGERSNLNGSQEVKLPEGQTLDQTYKLACNGPGGSNSDIASVQVNAPPLKVNLTASTNTLAAGEELTLNWNTTNVDSCTATEGKDTDNNWLGNKTTNGSQPVSIPENSLADIRYTLNCQGTFGSQNDSVLITVNKPSQPQLDFTINGTNSNVTVKGGTDLTFDWNVTNPSFIDNCTANVNPDPTENGGEPWNGGKSKEGDITREAPNPETSTDYDYNLVCKPKYGYHTPQVESVLVTALPALEVSCKDVFPKTIRGDNKVNISAEIENPNGVEPFKYILDPDTNSSELPEQESSFTTKSTWNWLQSYKEASIGKKTPEITVETENGQVSTDTCETITNFGNGEIREVQP